MSLNYTIYYDRENNVKLVVSKGKVLFIFLPDKEINHYRSVEILKDNYFKMDDLFEFWKNENLPLDMLDTINRVCKKFHYADFKTAHKVLPSSVVDQSDLNNIYSFVVSSDYGLTPASPKELKRQAKQYFLGFKIQSLDNLLDGMVAIEKEYESNFGDCSNIFDIIICNKKHFVRFDIYPQRELERFDREPGYYIPERSYVNISENRNRLEQYINDEFYGANK